MTTKDYTVAYPNTLIHRRERTCQVKVDSITRRNDIISQLCLEYPDYTEDLKRASLYKVSHSLSMASYLPSIPVPGRQC